ncbi:MAG: hypothetical protein L6R36_003863 [Xanthoria steineri]|nr:MAG: hypothetical protein L6R36_003863 [Xanthoria steineri]
MAVETTARPEAPTADFKGDVHVHNTVPRRKDVERIAELPVLDKDGKPHTFSSLLAPANNKRSRTLVIFIRHFFCGNCQEYLRSLCSSVTPEVLQSLSPPMNMRIVGCGQPELIPMYARETKCPYPIYADPSKKLYAELGMIRTLSLGPKAPQYMQYSLPSAMIRSIYQNLKAGRSAFKGGDYFQVGGEFIFDDGGVTWCHRMKNTRDHAEVPELRRQLGLDGAKPPLRKTFSSGIRRSSSQLSRQLSDRRKSWSRSRDRTDKPSPDGSMMEKVKEDQAAEENSERESKEEVKTTVP